MPPRHAAKGTHGSILRIVSLGTVVALFVGVLRAAWAEPALTVTHGELRHDFGEVGRGEKLTHRITLRNDGEEPVAFIRTKRGCGRCAPLRLNRRSAPPGETVSITAQFDSESRRGRQTRRYFLYTDESPSSPTLTLEFAWTVRPFMRVSPPQLDFGKKGHASPWRGSVVLDPADLKTTVTLTKLACSSPHVRIGEAWTDPTTGKIAIPLEILDSAPAGPFLAHLVIETDHPRERRLLIPVRGTIVGPFQVTARYMSFGVVAQGEGARREVKIAGPARDEERITGMDYDGQILACGLERARSGLYIVRADLRQGLQPGSYRTTVTLRTSCPAQVTIPIPVLVRVR